MKKLLLLGLLLAIAGCGINANETSFTKLQSLAASNAEKAIKDLKVFIYHHPEHAESKVLLGELLVSQTKVDERDMYLAQFYLKQAIEIADADLANKAEELILQAQLRRGLAPGDPEALVNLAKFAEKNKRYQRAIELFIKASYENLYLDEFTKASTNATEAINISNKFLIDSEPANWQGNYEESLAILATINLARGRLEAAQENLAKLKELNPALNISYEELPTLELTASLIASTDKVSTKSLLAWRPGFMKADDSSGIKEEDLLQELAKAEEKNKDNLNKLRNTLSYHLWKSYLSTLDKAKYPEITNFVEGNINFYEIRIN